MIISRKHKYIFIAHPSSGGTAIMNELLENYDGEILYHKHCNYPPLINDPSIKNLKDNFVFGVVRDPIDKSFSEYNKIKFNANNQYTNENFFIENGGNVSKKMRKVYYKVKKLKSFEEYLKFRYRFKLYHDWVTINSPYLNGIIRFDKISKDFELIIKKLNLPLKRSLPQINKTSKKDSENYLNPKIKKRIFGPYYNFNSKIFEESKQKKISFIIKIYYKILNYIYVKLVTKKDTNFIQQKRGLNHK